MFSCPDLVIFDLDNTLYDYDVAKFAGENALINYLNESLKISQNEIKDLLISSRRNVKEWLGATASSHSRLIYLREFLKTNNFNVHATLLLSVSKCFGVLILIKWSSLKESRNSLHICD